MYVCTYVRMYVSIYLSIYLSIYECMYVCMYTVLHEPSRVCLKFELFLPEMEMTSAKSGSFEANSASAVRLGPPRARRIWRPRCPEYGRLDLEDHGVQPTLAMPGGEGIRDYRTRECRRACVARYEV